MIRLPTQKMSDQELLQEAKEMMSLQEVSLISMINFRESLIS